MDFVLGTKVTNWYAPDIVRPQGFFLAARVLRHHRRGRVQNGHCRAIVLLQLDHFRIRVVAFEIEDIAHVGTAETVHTLVVIAHHAQVPVFRRQEMQQVILRHVRVLILVHHDIAPAVLIALENVRVTAEELHGEHEQVVKIHRGIVAQGALVQGIDAGHHLIEAKIPGITQEGVGIDQVILERADTAHDRLRGIQLLVDLQLLGALFHQGELVSRIINHELGRESERLGLAA